MDTTPAPQIQLLILALYKFIYLLTYLLTYTKDLH